MKVLGIDTTRKAAKVFVVDTKEIDNSVYLDMSENIKHSEGLFLYIEKIMSECKLSIPEVDAFACIVGPGSFTGIRVGMSVIKGFNKVANKSVISMNTFEVLKDCVKNGVILLNSTNTSCYYAKVEKKAIVDTGVVDKTAIEEFADGKDVYVLVDEQNVISTAYSNIKVITNINELYAKCIIEKLDSMQYGEFVPYYLQLSQAERYLKND